jgi:hypothetical protein
MYKKWQVQRDLFLGWNTLAKAGKDKYVPDFHETSCISAVESKPKRKLNWLWRTYTPHNNN